MNVNVLRTLQVGIALVVITVVTIAILVITGFLSVDDGLAIGLDVSAVIGICMVAGMALIALFGIGGPRGG
ncbi:MAG: hypothetical protein RLW61_19355 [Gammaproteobacteria bacterium]